MELWKIIVHSHIPLLFLVARCSLSYKAMNVSTCFRFFRLEVPTPASCDGRSVMLTRMREGEETVENYERYAQEEVVGRLEALFRYNCTKTGQLPACPAKVPNILHHRSWWRYNPHGGPRGATYFFYSPILALTRYGKVELHKIYSGTPHENSQAIQFSSYSSIESIALRILWAYYSLKCTKFAQL
jgi:hypothetical protein